ncbi:MAG: methyltransferase domain-containing protein [Bacteroidota bacterium]
MTHQEAVALIQAAPLSPGQSWADLGAGAGRFSMALAELLGPEGVVWAVDKKPGRLVAEPGQAEMKVLRQDFMQPMSLPLLDGILMANALHYVADQKGFLSEISTYLHPGGQFMLIEYDRARRSPWVPYPLSSEEFRLLAGQVGLTEVKELGRMPSRYGNGDMYAMWGKWPG